MSLLAAYAFNEGTGTTAAEVDGGTSLTSIPGWTASGRHDDAMEAALTWGPLADPYASATNFTIMLDVWVLGDGGTGINILLEEPTMGILQADSSGVLQWYCFFSNNVENVATLSDGQWYNLAITADGTTRRTYIEGVTGPTAANTNRVGTDTIRVAGARDGTTYTANVRVDNVRFFDTALTQPEIAALAGTAVTPAATTGVVTSSFGGTFTAAGEITDPPVRYISQGAAVAGTTSITTAAYGTGWAEGDLGVYVVASNEATGLIDATVAGFNNVGTLEGGTGTKGAGTGPRRLTFFTRTLQAGDDTTPAIDLTGGNVMVAACTIFRKADNVAWVTAVSAFGAETTAGTSWSQAMTSDPGFNAEDMAVLACAVCDTSGSSAEGITATGATFGTVTERADLASETGNDINLHVNTCVVTAGPSSANATCTATHATSDSGVMGVLRIRAISAGVSGVVTSSFGGTFATSGTVRKLGAVVTSFGGAFLGAGNDRQFGQVTSTFGATFTATGVVRKLGAGVSSFGGTFTAAGASQTPAIQGQVISSFGGTFSASGIDRVLGAAVSNFGGAFLGVGNDRQFGSVASEFGGTFATAGIKRILGVVTTSFGFDQVVIGQRKVLGQAVSTFGGTLDAIGEVPFNGPMALAAYNFDENADTTAAEINGGTSITGVPGWGVGRQGSALSLDSVMGPTIDPFVSDTDFTVMMDVYIFDAGDTGYNMFLHADLGNFGTLQASAAHLLEWYPATGVTAALSLNTWYNVAITANGTIRRLLLDGVLATSGSDANRSGTDTLNLGGMTGYLPNIRIDNLRIFDTILSDVDIAALAGTPVVPGGSNPATTGTVTSSFGGTFNASGTRRVIGAVASSFGGAFLGAGNDRQFGQVTSAFGFVSTALGVSGSTGVVTTSFGFVSTVSGRRRSLGQVVSLFGGTLTTVGSTGAPVSTGFFASGGVFVALTTEKASGGLWVSSLSQKFALGGSWLPDGSSGGTVYGAAVSLFGGTLGAAGIDRVRGNAAGTFGGTLAVAGVVRTFGVISSLFGGTLAAAGSVPTGWPTALTTGTTGTLTTSAVDTLDSPGATYNNMHFTHTGYRFWLNAPNMTFNNCKWDSAPYFNEQDGISMYDCEMAQGLMISSASDIIIERAKIENFYPDDAIHITNDGAGGICSNITIRDCYIYNANPALDSHSDGFQVRGSVGLHVDHCYVDMGPWDDAHNAAFYAEGVQGGNTTMLIENNFFKTGHGYTLYIHSVGDGGIFRYNTIADADRGSGGFGYQWGPSPGSYDDTGGNTIFETGLPYDIQSPPP